MATATPPAPPATPTAIPTASPTAPAQQPTATPVPATPTPAPPGEARHGGTLALAGREDIAHYDVHQEVSPALSTWGPGIIYSRLLRFKSGPDVVLPSLAVECELCESWVMEDATTFVFRLRHGVHWQSIDPVNGRELTAGDVVFSYNRQRQQGWPNAPLLQTIETIEALGQDSVRIGLKVPDADFLLSLADGHSKIVAPEAVAVNGDLQDGPNAGSGPWVLTGTSPSGSHTFARNPDYFEPGLPYLDALTIHIIPDPDTRAAAFRVGTIDVLDVEPQEWQELRQRPGSQGLLVPEPGVGLELALKTTQPPLDKLAVRQAIFQAMDPWKAAQEIWQGAAYQSAGVPPAAPGWLLPESELRQHLGQPEEARRLLQAAGVTAPVSLTIRVGNFGEAYEAHAQRVAEELRAVGFDPTVEVVNRQVFGEEVWLGGQYQMFLGPVAPVVRPNDYLLGVLHSRGAWNTAGYRSPVLDGLIEAQAREYDPLERQRLALGVQRHVLANAFRFMPAGRVSIWTWAPRVRDFHPNFAGYEYAFWARVWVSG